MRVLVLGGTAEARALAAGLVAEGVEVVSSLAGRVSHPVLPPGRVRIGGFGGVSGLVTYLRTEAVGGVVDATHPFATTISAHAAAACAEVGVALVRLERPGWAEHTDASAWTWVSDAAEALDVGAGCTRPFLTTGRQGLAAFLPWADRTVLVRTVDPPVLTLPVAWRLLQSRGPYDLPGERAILAGHRIDLLVTKDSGGDHTTAKLDAAAELGVPVIVIRRPPRPSTVVTVPDIETALTFVSHRVER